MTDRALCFGAGKESTFDAKDAFLFGGGALFANGGANSLTVAEVANLVKGCLKEIESAVNLLEDFLVEEQKSVIFEAFEFLVSLHLLLEILRNKLTLLTMTSKLVRTDKGFLAFLRLVRAFEYD